jgi:hypothetical protein
MDSQDVETRPVKRKSFKETDTLTGWPVPEADSRVAKYIRTNAKEIDKSLMPNRFDVYRLVTLPPSYLLQEADDVPSSSTVGDGAAATDAPPSDPIKNDRGDIYEAFRRTSDMSIRGIFANGEPVWGTAHYRNGMQYTGSFSGGVADGFGEKHAGKSVYRGRFVKGLRHGRGCLLDSNNYRLFLGMFKDDAPDGEVLMIMFGWSNSKKRSFTAHTLVTFFKGEPVKKVDNVTCNNAQGRSGLHPEEFMEMFRMAERLVEATTSRKRLLEMKAEETLVTEFDVYPFPS